jgi:hypothetical protein
MAAGTSRLPLIRGQITVVETYGRKGQVTPPQIPRRDPQQHRAALLQQLDAITDEVNKRQPGERDPAASRELIVIRPEPESEMPDRSLAEGVRLVGTDPDTGTVLLDAPGPDLPQLRQKIEEFGDDSKVNKPKEDGTVSRANEKAIAPIREIALATSADRFGGRDRPVQLELTKMHWFEIGCRGGYRQPLMETEHSREQIRRQLVRLGLSDQFEEFVGPEQVYFFVRATPEQLEVLIESTDCVYEWELAAPDVRGWLMLEEQPAQQIRTFELHPPPETAPSVVVLDTGITTTHPLLSRAIHSANSVVPGIDSPEDTCGHGTRMAGVSLYSDVRTAVEAGSAIASHWLQSVKILVTPHAGTASDSEENRRLWPRMTEDAIKIAEKVDSFPRQRAFALAVTRPIEPVEPTLWSHALDQLAYGDGRGRLLCVSAGNARPDRWLELARDYPQLHLTEKIQDPAQAANVLTVGAYTTKASIPPSAIYEEGSAIAPRGGISPYTTTGPQGAPWPVKPDVVLEGGNLLVAGALPDSNVATLVTITTGHRLLINKPLSTIAMTSEATAHAARMAAAIWAVEPSLRPETVRGLIVHSAAWTPIMMQQFPSLDDRLAACGYGVPDPVFARECAKDRATVIVEDEIPNAVKEEVPKKKPPKRAATKLTEPKLVRKMKVFRLPVPDDIALHTNTNVELRVTLSYFPEPNKFHRRVYHGLDLKWDMQRPQESEAEFLERVNEFMRPLGADGKRRRTSTKTSFSWLIGPQKRSRGTVQSDRWRGRAAYLAGSKLIAVYPVLGWWDQRKELRTCSMRFSLIVSVTGPDIYSPIKAALTLPVEVGV